MQSVNQNIIEISKKIGEKLNMLTKFSLYAIIFILLIIILLQKCGNDRNIKQIQKIAEQNYIAIQDSFKLVKKTDKEIIYVDRTEIKYITKYKDRNKISEINFGLESSNKKIDTINLSKNDSNIVLNDYLEISDSLPNLSYKMSLTPLNNSYLREFNYTYRTNIKIEMKKDKNGIFSTITSNDTNLNIVGGNSVYYMPTKKEQRIKKLKKIGIYVGSAIIFSSGVYLGTKF
jgi:hypothetical protein